MALLGLYVGVIPVSLGLLWLPFIRRAGEGRVRWQRFHVTGPTTPSDLRFFPSWNDSPHLASLGLNLASMPEKSSNFIITRRI